MATAAAVGDLASVKWAVTLADGKPLPQQGQVFDQGDVRMVVGAGGFLPCLHKKVAGMSVGDKASVDVAPADAFGESNPMMGPVDIPAAQAPAGLEAGMLVQLATGQKARVTQVTADAVTIDANMPLAGAALKMDVELLAVEAGAASLEKADFALGCFWGAELAFQREKGVVSTKVGYTQGAKESPTYEEVCSGKARARAHAARMHARTHTHTHTRTHARTHTHRYAQARQGTQSACRCCLIRKRSRLSACAHCFGNASATTASSQTRSDTGTPWGHA